MEQRLSLVTLGVRDLAASRRFYEAMGWKPANMKAEGVVFFQLGGIALGLFGRDALAKDAGVKDSEPAFSGVTLAHNVRDKAEVATVLAHAERCGGRIVKPAQDVFWGGYHGYFADPDGHLWEVAWNPFFPLKGDGSIVLPT
jgi:catechol 2,3-dioxygenase-like lactoylglutathione lyase family enzyme